MGKHWSERSQLTCQCGHVSRNSAEEAGHRHNFPLMCREPKASVTVRMPKSLHGRLKALAEARGLTLNDLMLEAVRGK